MFKPVYTYKNTHNSEYHTDDKGRAVEFDNARAAHDYVNNLVDQNPELLTYGSFTIVEQYNH